MFLLGAPRQLISTRLDLALDVDGAAPKFKRIRRLEIRVIREPTYVLHPLSPVEHFSISITHVVPS